MVEQWNKDGETVEPLWWNSRTMMGEQFSRDGGTVEQWWWNSGTVEQRW